MRGKPAGSIVRLERFRWWVDDVLPEPVLGMFLVSAAGSGYEVVGIEETGRSGPEHAPRVFNLICRKIEPSRIPDGSIMGLLYWEPRSKRT